MPTPRVTLPVSSAGTALQTSIELSQLAYGVWRLGEDPEGTSLDRILAKIDTCLELGITTFDHADIYGGYSCEELFGRALKERPGLRDRLEIITKCDICLVDEKRPQHKVKHYNTSERHLRSSVEHSLESLGTDHVDLLLLHRPDPLMNAEETADALVSLHRDGKVLAFGVSNFTPAQTELLRMRLNLPIVANQIELSALSLEPFFNGTLEHAQQHHIQPMAWSPLAGGRLFIGKDDQATRVRNAMIEVGKEVGHELDAVALAWLLRHPTTPIPIIGTNKPERIQSAAKCLDIELSRQQWFQIYEAGLGEEVA